MRWLPMIFLAILACGCSGGNSTRDAEALVKKYIENNANGKVEFVKFGPHMSKMDLISLEREAGSDLKIARYDAVIRVVYKSDMVDNHAFGWKKQEYKQNDQVFCVTSGSIESVSTWNNKDGDNWIGEARKSLAKTYPGIK